MSATRITFLSGQKVDQFNVKLGRLEDSTTAQVTVVCLNSIGDAVPKGFATALFRKWGLGYQQKNNGLLILLVKNQRCIEMETGYALKRILPDAVCKRIQAEKMVMALNNGDFDGAFIAGVEEVIREINEPEAAKEVYNSGKFVYVQPLDNFTVFLVFILIIPILLIQRAYYHMTRRRNPIVDEVENGLSKPKLRGVRAFLIYVIIPLCLGFVVVRLRDPLHLHGWHFALVMYAYLIYSVWDARRRRRKVFDLLYGNLPEAEWCSRRKAVRFNGWDNVLLFPIPFIWLKTKDDRAIRRVRNHPRESGGCSTK